MYKKVETFFPDDIFSSRHLVIPVHYVVPRDPHSGEIDFAKTHDETGHWFLVIVANICNVGNVPRDNSK